jgi:hypothetical protein
MKQTLETYGHLEAKAKYNFLWKRRGVTWGSGSIAPLILDLGTRRN